jgi:hypothetical protein
MRMFHLQVLQTYPVSFLSLNVCIRQIVCNKPSFSNMLATGTGTIDFVPYLSVRAALEFREWLGGEDKINAYCHSLALTGGKHLAEVLGTTVMDEDGDMTANMVHHLFCYSHLLTRC